MEQEKKRTTKPKQTQGTRCTHTRKDHLTGHSMYMLHKAYPALNLSRHLAHLTGTQKKPEKGSHKHTQDDGTHAQRNRCNFFRPCYKPLSGSIKISKTVNKQKKCSKQDAAFLFATRKLGANLLQFGKRVTRIIQEYIMCLDGQTHHSFVAYHFLDVDLLYIRRVI